jgi:hypothetical protein
VDKPIASWLSDCIPMTISGSCWYQGCYAHWLCIMCTGGRHVHSTTLSPEHTQRECQEHNTAHGSDLITNTALLASVSGNKQIPCQGSARPAQQTTPPCHSIQIHVFASNCQGGGRASSVVHVLNCYSANPVSHYQRATRMVVTWLPKPFFFTDGRPS